jgi:glycosyltransferase involved in cell wall biosynthesis
MNVKQNKPLVSIITVVYNGEKYLEKTIQSVINQTYTNIEYIIIDGGSSDNTVDIIKKYDNYISYWISEKDNGIYNAMNKGIKIANGEIIAILNSDDYYKSYAVENSVNNIINYNVDFSYANINIIDPKTNKSHLKKAVFKTNIIKQKIYQEMVYPHITLFIKKSVYKEIGLFDETFRIAGDHEFILRMYVNKYKGKYLNKVIANAMDDGISSDTKSNYESKLIAQKYGKSILSTNIKYLLFIFKKKLKHYMPKNFYIFWAKKFGSRHYYE